MNILIDLVTSQRYPSMKFHGGGEYIKAIFFELIKTNTEHRLFFVLSKKLDTPNEILEKLEGKKIIYLEDGILKEIEKNNIERFFVATATNYIDIKFSEKLELIVTIHDLRALEIVYDNTSNFYDLSLKREIFSFLYRVFSFFFLGEKLIKQFRKKIHYKKFSNFYNRENIKIITDSKHSKNMLLTQVLKKEIDINVLYCPEKFILKKIIREEFKFSYVLLISANRLEKNNFRGIIALDELITDKLFERKVIVVGKIKGKILKKIKNKDNFIFLDYVEDIELENLYRNARTFIFSTITEGFGYPPIEAMKYGVPILSSAITATTEILGDAPLYFNPFSIEEIKARIYQLEDEEEYQNRKNKSLKKFKEISLKQNEDLKKITKIILN
ncbi:glycosyltransferase [Fusobacterium varium]